jgi:hypothetical protein
MKHFSTLSTLSALALTAILATACGIEEDDKGADNTDTSSEAGAGGTSGDAPVVTTEPTTGTNTGDTSANTEGDNAPATNVTVVVNTGDTSTDNSTNTNTGDAGDDNNVGPGTGGTGGAGGSGGTGGSGGSDAGGSGGTGGTGGSGGSGGSSSEPPAGNCTADDVHCDTSRGCYFEPFKFWNACDGDGCTASIGVFDGYAENATAIEVRFHQDPNFPETDTAGGPGPTINDSLFTTHKENGYNIVTWRCEDLNEGLHRVTYLSSQSNTQPLNLDWANYGTPDYMEKMCSTEALYSTNCDPDVDPNVVGWRVDGLPYAEHFEDNNGNWACRFVAAGNVTSSCIR